MSPKIIFALFMGLVIFIIPLFSTHAQEEDLYSFEVEEFTKKVWEWKGDISATGREKLYRKESVLYPVKFQSIDESQSSELELQVSLESRWDWEWSRLFLAGEANGLRSTISEHNEEDAFLREAYFQLSQFEPHTFDAGKRLLRWGKGYAFNPVALLERPKNPEDPEESREGLWMWQGIWIPGGFSIFQTTSVNLVYLPVRDNLNDEFRADLEQENLFGLRLYALIRTTDIDVYFVTRTDEQKTDVGIDFSTNITTNFEVHGEYAAKESINSRDHEALLGIRYLTRNDVTWIAEVFHDSEGLKKKESTEIYQLIEEIPPSQAYPYVSMIQQDKTVSQNYAYIKASIKDPFNILYFTPSLSCIGNLDDQSTNITTQLAYSPTDNWLLEISWQHLSGDRYTQYGENIVQDKVELTATYSF